MTDTRVPGTLCSSHNAVPLVSATTSAARGYAQRRSRSHMEDKFWAGGWVCSVAMTRHGRLRAASTASTDDVVIMPRTIRSEEHTSELQSLMRISYAVFCLKKKNININKTLIITNIHKILYTKQTTNLK